MERMVGPAPEMSISVCGTLTKGLLDTGSAVSIMSKSFFDSISALRNVKDLVVNIADGSTLPHHGYVKADFEIPGVRDSVITVPCLVVSDTDYNRQVPIKIGTSYINECFENQCLQESLPEGREMARKTMALSKLSTGSVRSTNTKHVFI